MLAASSGDSAKLGKRCARNSAALAAWSGKSAMARDALAGRATGGVVEVGFMPGILGILGRLGRNASCYAPAVEAKALGVGLD